MEPVNARPQWLRMDTYVAPTTWQEKVQRVANDLIAATAVLGTVASRKGLLRGASVYIYYGALALMLRKVIAVIIGHAIHPCATPWSSLQRFHTRLAESIRDLEGMGYIIQPISIWKSGNRFDACIITHERTIDTGKWQIPALGNYQWFNDLNLEEFVVSAKKMGCSSLIINPPSVNGSGGWPLPYQQGACYDAALSFLEEHANPKKIVMSGFSLGGAFWLKGVLAHTFKTDRIAYLMISKCTFSCMGAILAAFTELYLLGTRYFSRLATIASIAVDIIARPILWVLGLEYDGIAASQKLSNLGIRQVVMQHRTGALTTDGIIPDRAGLAHNLHEKEIEKDKVFIEDARISHNWIHFQSENLINYEIKTFLKDGA